MPNRVRCASALVIQSAVIALSILTGSLAEAKVFLTTDEALALAFPGCEIERHTVFLTEPEVEQARKLAGGEKGDRPSALVHPYVATRRGALVGTAYIDRHRVRTLSETVMVVVDTAGKVARVEVLAFDEPENYLPRAAWYEQFENRGLDNDLVLKRGIRGLSGATLTARATTQAVRRVLALHRVIATSSRGRGSTGAAQSRLEQGSVGSAQ